MKIKITWKTKDNKTNSIIFDRSGVTFVSAIVDVIDLGYCSHSAILKVEKIIEK